MWKASLFVALFGLAALVAGTPPTPCSAPNNGGCGANAICYNAGTTVSCACVQGYFKDDAGVCVGVNACATNNGGCHANAECATTIGTWSVTCTCVAPYTGNGWWCQSPPVDLCQTNNGGCGLNAACYGGNGPAVTCVCNNGYYKNDEQVCVAINACATNNGGCSEYATCAAPLATWDVTCTCTGEYQGDGWYCALPVEGNNNGNTGNNNGGNNGGSNTPGWDCPDVPASFWDWRYPRPTCQSLTVFYPEDLPDGQANDVNIRIHTDNGDITLNFHNNDGCWSGQTVFDIRSHPNFPAGLEQQGYSIVWVQVGGTNCHWSGDVDCTPATEPEEPEEPGMTPPFTWNWEYPTPTCEDGVVVTYPSNIPGDQANDANIRIITNVGSITLNFHNNNGFWSGTHTFDIEGHPNFPAGVTSYTIVWVQIGGTNYHWQGSVVCA